MLELDEVFVLAEDYSFDLDKFFAVPQVEHKVELLDFVRFWRVFLVLLYA